MKRFIIFVEFIQIMAVFYLGVELVFEFKLGMALLMFICIVNMFVVSMVRVAHGRIERANLELYKGFAKRLGWEDIVSDLNDIRGGL